MLSPAAPREKKIPAMLRGNFWPVVEDVSSPQGIDFPVTFGSLPMGLRGTYVRNGPNNAFDLEDGQAYHFFDGDGMLLP